MGAPGYYVLCSEGHIVGIIEDDLYWGEPEDESSVYKELERLENDKCKICGKRAKYSFCHYGDINDCLDYNNRIEWNRYENRYIIPLDHKGNVILRSKPVYVKAPRSLLDKEEKINLKYIEKLENIQKQKGIQFRNKKEFEKHFSDNLIISKGKLGYTIILDSGGGYEVVLRMKKEVARELRDKLDILLSR